MAQDFAVIGKRLPRPDAPAKATGAAIYTGDIRLPRRLIGKALRSPYPHARIVKINKAKAAAIPGVAAVITFADIPQKRFNAGKAGLISRYPGAHEEPQDQYILADKARYIGDAVAAVAAVSDAVAQEALAAIEVEYEVLPAVFDPLEAMKAGAPRIHQSESNAVWYQSYPFAEGNVEKAFQEADFVVEASFTTSRQKHAQLESMCCIASFDPNGRLTIWSPDQEPFIARMRIARIFDIPEGMIRWITPTIGGAFGNGLSLRSEPICVALARKTGRPVRMEYTPEEHFVNTENRQSFIQTGKIGVKKDGSIIAMETKMVVDAGAYFTLSAHTTAVNMAFFLGRYRCPNRAGSADIVYTNTPPTGGMRGYGNAEGTFVLEQLIDMAAEKLGMDPLEFRLKNFKRAGEPGRNPAIPIESCALDECIRVGSERIGWGCRTANQKDGIKRRGIGMAIMMHGSGAYPGLLEHSTASISLNQDGSANLLVGAVELGQGVLGVLCQIAAEELGLRAEDIHITAGDTDTTTFNTGTHASRSTYVIGNTVQRAAAQAKSQLLERAARNLNAPREELEARSGRVYRKASPEKWVSIAALVKNAIFNPSGQQSNICGYCSWEPTGNPPPLQAAFAEVEVDTQTGKVDVLRMVLAHDIGRAINPMSAEGQLEGALMQGIGYCLTEDFIIDKTTGIVTTSNFKNYRIPTALEVPQTEIILVEQPTPSGPFGAKSVGESGMNPIAPAIANAIYDAAGVRVRDLPLTPEKVLVALRSPVLR